MKNLLKIDQSKFLRITGEICVFFLIFLLSSSSAYAQGKMDQQVSQPLLILISLSALALVPIVLIMVTSFIKISVVLSLVRNALGTQQIPPNQVITGLALILTIYIMLPVATQSYRNAEGTIKQTSSQGVFSPATLALAETAVDQGKEPMRAFLMNHAGREDKKLFYNLAKQMREKKDADLIQENDFLVLVPSFIISELASAFKIGFIVFLPFLVIDMVVANILLSLGMFQLSPVTVSLPFKLLLFVLVNGWYLIAQGLVLGYK